MLFNNYYKELDQNNSELNRLESESTFALCYAMVCSQYGN